MTSKIGEVITLNKNIENIQRLLLKQEKSVNDRWVSRIKKRIDELKASREIDRQNHVDRTQIESGIIELEGLLRELP